MSAQPKIMPAPAATLPMKPLIAALTNACKVIERKETIPVLTAARITATGGGVSVVATDLDMITSTFVPGAVDPDFEVLAPAHTLLDILKKSDPETPVRMEPGDKAIHVAIGDLTLTLNAAGELKDFPKTEAFQSNLEKTNCRFTLPADTFRDALERVKIAISTEATRYYLNGVLFQAVNDNFVIVATDGHRLVRVRLDLPEAAGALPDIIAPRAFIHEVLRHLKAKNCPDHVDIAATDSGVSISIGPDVVIESKVVDGSFPDYARCIPQAGSMSITVDRKDALSAVKKVTVITSERGRAVKLGATDGKLVFETRHPETGTAAVTIDAANDGPPREIGFNARYLTDALGTMTGDACLHFENEHEPCLMADRAASNVDYVLMPLQL
ncbi:MAG: DNA polymerase III subunit beta [Roseibium sp.]|nr:DNA polymerase III subunit beta [Roseibium sp.]